MACIAKNQRENLNPNGKKIRFFTPYLSIIFSKGRVVSSYSIDKRYLHKIISEKLLKNKGKPPPHWMLHSPSRKNHRHYHHYCPLCSFPVSRATPTAHPSGQSQPQNSGPWRMAGVWGTSPPPPPPRVHSL